MKNTFFILCAFLMSALIQAKEIKYATLNTKQESAIHTIPFSFFKVEDMPQRFMDSAINYKYNITSQQYDLSIKYVYRYNAQGNKTDEIQMSYNVILSKWDTVYKYVNIYDASGKILSNQIFYDSIPLQKSEYFYEGELVSYMIYSVWNVDASSWDYRKKGESEYDESARVKTYTDYTWDTTSASWLATSRDEYLYYKLNWFSNLTRSDWDAKSRSWVFNSKVDVSFDNNDNRNIEILSDWDTLHSRWDSHLKYDFTFNSNNDETSKTMYVWNSILGWQPDYKTEIQYFPNTRYTSSQSGYEWNGKLNQWDPLYKIEITNMENPDYEGISYNWSKETASWVPDFKYDLYFSELGTGLKDDVFSLKSCYPNPVKDRLYLYNAEGVDTVELVDTYGNILNKSVINGSIDVTGLQAGLYYVRWESSYSQSISKFVKQ